MSIPSLSPSSLLSSSSLSSNMNSFIEFCISNISSWNSYSIEDFIISPLTGGLSNQLFVITNTKIPISNIYSPKHHSSSSLSLSLSNNNNSNNSFNSSSSPDRVIIRQFGSASKSINNSNSNTNSSNNSISSSSPSSSSSSPPFELFDRSLEIEISQFLSSNHFGPPILYENTQLRIELYLPAHTLNTEDLLNPMISYMIAQQMARFHMIGRVKLYNNNNVNKFNNNNINNNNSANNNNSENNNNNNNNRINKNNNQLLLRIHNWWNIIQNNLLNEINNNSAKNNNNENNMNENDMNRMKKLNLIQLFYNEHYDFLSTNMNEIELMINEIHNKIHNNNDINKNHNKNNNNNNHNTDTNHTDSSILLSELLSNTLVHNDLQEGNIMIFNRQWIDKEFQLNNNNDNNNHDNDNNNNNKDNINNDNNNENIIKQWNSMSMNDIELKIHQYYSNKCNLNHNNNNNNNNNNDHYHHTNFTRFNELSLLTHEFDHNQPLISFIDFEYSHWDSPLFDFGNHFCEHFINYQNILWPNYKMKFPFHTNINNNNNNNNSNSNINSNTNTDIDNNDSMNIYFSDYEIHFRRFLMIYLQYYKYYKYKYKNNSNNNNDMKYEFLSIDPNSRIITDLLHYCLYYMLLSHYQWSIWSILMANSNISFGYLEYAKSRINEYIIMKEWLKKYWPLNCNK